MALRAPVLLAVLLAAAVAGCTGGDPSPPGSSSVPPPNYTPPVQPGKGIIIGVAVDLAVQPVPNATITLNVPGKAALKDTTNVQGSFSFKDLDPGTYFITAEKRGYASSQASTDVKADVKDPPAVKIQLQPDPKAFHPFFEPYQFKGYIECSTSAIYVSAATCSTFNGMGVLPDDEPYVTYVPSAANLTFVQSELVWTATQAAGEFLTLDYEAPIGSVFVANTSKSPVVVKAGPSLLKARGVSANGYPVIIGVSAGGVDGTNPGQIPDPLGAQFTGLGVAFEQSYDVYTVLFYGYRPPLDWSFGKDSTVPPPPQ